MKPVIIFDIETVVDVERVDTAEGSCEAYLDKLRVEQDTADPWVPWTYHLPVVVAGVYLKSGGPHPFVYRLDDEDEPPIANRFWRLWQLQEAQLVTWNGRGFDLPVLELEGMRCGAALAGWLNPPGTKSWEDPRNRFSGGHFDLCDYFSNTGGAPRPSQHAFAAALGLPGKLDVDGAGVAKLYEAGKMQEIADYCVCDVLTLAAIFFRYLLAVGGDPALAEERMEKIKSGFDELGYGHAVGKWERAA